MKVRIVEFRGRFIPEYEHTTFWGRKVWLSWGNEDVTVEFDTLEKAMKWLNAKRVTVYECGFVS